MDFSAEDLLASAQSVRRRLQAEVIAAEATAQRDNCGKVVGDEAAAIARLQAKVEYLNSIVLRHEMEIDQATGWPVPVQSERSAAISSFA